MQQATAAGGTVGAVWTGYGTQYRVWAPGSEQVEVVVERGGRAYALKPGAAGWHEGLLAEVRPGDRYRLRLDSGEEYPDPLSRFQPDGVHGASEVVDLAGFPWTDEAWRGRRLEELVIYELHVGTATEPGTFAGLVERLPYLARLGVTAIELMPVAEFPGHRNWGYDGTFPFAPARAYGGPDGLRRLVDAAHGQGLAIILDVVYNHFGPEGNYLPAVTGGRIFTERHHTPWGPAVNYDDDGADGVRQIVLENVRQWVRDYHVDGLRLDATHAILDSSTPHILQQIGTAAREVPREVVVIAEDERNERRLLLPVSEGGMGMDGVWADDAHHVLRRLTAGDRDGYYAAYDGSARELARAIRQGWLYQGETYAPSGEPRGTPAAGIPPQRFVHCIQNHDQVGNRALGERLNHQVGLDVYRAASALLLLTPCTPLLWMGQEWAATSPFQYFTDHPEELGRRVTAGRREEFRHFAQFADQNVRERIPDPQAPETFARSRLRWSEAAQQPHAGVLALYRELLRLRREHPALRERDRDSWEVQPLSDGSLSMRRGTGEADLLLLVCLDGTLDVDLAGLDGRAPRPWEVVLWSEEARFGGAGGSVAQQGGRLALGGPGAVLLQGR